MSVKLKDRLRPHIVKTLQKTGLNRVAHKLYYNHLHGFDTANQAVLDAQRRCFELAADDPALAGGDYMEFGIFKGYAFWHAQKLATDLAFSNMRFFGFDSFAGLPEIEADDQSENDVFYQGQYKCAREVVEKNLTAKGVDWQRTFLVEGYFDQSLTPEVRQEFNMQRIAVALIDCDLYTSTRDVLAFIDGLIQDNSVLMFDDWNCFDKDDQRGQRRAFGEFLDAHPTISAEPLFDYGAYGTVFRARTT